MYNYTHTHKRAKVFSFIGSFVVWPVFKGTKPSCTESNTRGKHGESHHCTTFNLPHKNPTLTYNCLTKVIRLVYWHFL